jgi:hypothetical protein
MALFPRKIDGSADRSIAFITVEMKELLGSLIKT